MSPISSPARPSHHPVFDRLQLVFAYSKIATVGRPKNKAEKQLKG